MKVISGQGLDPVAFRQTADASGRLARSVRETTPSDVLPLDPHKGGDPRRLFTRPGTPLAKRGETIGKQIGNVPTGGRRGCPTKRRDFPLRNPPPTLCFYMRITFGPRVSTCVSHSSTWFYMT